MAIQAEKNKVLRHYFRGKRKAATIVYIQKWQDSCALVHSKLNPHTPSLFLWDPSLAHLDFGLALPRKGVQLLKTSQQDVEIKLVQGKGS